MRRSKLIISIACIILTAFACTTNLSPRKYDTDTESALKSLQRVLFRQKTITDLKEAQIDSLRVLIPGENQAERLYGLYDRLFDEYLQWNSDSALLYAHRKAEIANLLNDLEMKEDAAIDLADRYIISGMYNEALMTISGMESEGMRAPSQNARWMYLKYKIYHGLVQATNDEMLRCEYRPMERKYLLLCKEQLNDSQIEYYNIQANLMLEDKRYQDIVNLMENKLQQPVISNKQKGVLLYWQAKAYNDMGDKSKAFLYYILSAKYDLLCPVREYHSLIRVAQICFQDGEISLAYRLITQCYSDALIADAKIRLLQIGSSLPQILSTYEAQLKRNREIRMRLLYCLFFLLAALSIAVISLKKNHTRLAMANNEINDKLKELQESNTIKDAYLGQFLTMFSEHINSLERYRSELRTTAKQMDLNTLLQELRSDKFIDSEWEYLYDKFDTTFLGLFPDFAIQVNHLLRPEVRINCGLKNGKLNNKLRVCALIRLGVSESEQIAQFLRLSVTTIFNYRVQLRNASAGTRDEFETNLMKIGNFQQKK